MTKLDEDYGYPRCPYCNGRPTSRHMTMSIFAHFCLTYGEKVYWDWNGLWNPTNNFTNLED